MKLFGGDMVTSVYNKLGADENMPIAFGPLSKAVESAQKKVEGRNFSIRKHVLSYDDVMNTQREIIYGQRRQVLDGENVKSSIENMLNESCEMVLQTYMDEINHLDDSNREAITVEVQNRLNIDHLDELDKEKPDYDKLLEELKKKVFEKYEEKEKDIGEEAFRELERVVLLKVVDDKWMDHIDAMDELKDGIGLRAYGQKDPVIQYQIEGSEMFDEMINDIKLDVSKIILSVQKRESYERRNSAQITDEGREDIAAMLDPKALEEEKKKKREPIVNNGPKVGRNDLCPCRKPVRSIKTAVVEINSLKKEVSPK